MRRVESRERVKSPFLTGTATAPMWTAVRHTRRRLEMLTRILSNSPQGKEKE